MDSIMTQLHNIEKEVKKLKRESQFCGKVSLVIEADPSYPPVSLQSLIQSLSTNKALNVSITVHEHSSCGNVSSKNVTSWPRASVSNCSRMENHLNLTWIWKPDRRYPIAKFVNQSLGDIRGETTIARLLARLLESWTDCNLYENFDLCTSAQIDGWLDLWEECTQSNPSGFVKLINTRLANASWLAGPPPGTRSLADVFLSSALTIKGTTPHVKDWLSRCNSA